MSKLSLKNIDIICVDCLDFARSNNALEHSIELVDFGNAFLLTSLECPNTTDYTVVKIPHIGSIQEYSRFMVRDLINYCFNEFILIVQWDGFVVNPQHWQSEFLDYDYLGAVWGWIPYEYRVGNGGFSLRSRKFIQVGSTVPTDCVHPEDETLCRTYKHYMLANGIKYAPPELCSRFSIEGGDYSNSFGWHMSR